MRIAILPHMGGWKSVADGYRSWNEPLDYAFSTKFSIEDSSLMDCGGYELSAAYVEGDDIIVRLFNRNTASESRRVGLAPSIVSIEEIDLLGNAIRKFEIQNGSFEVSMPGLGFRTFRLGKSSASNKNINK